MVEVVFANRKDGFKDYPSIVPELDLVEESDQFTHMLTLEDNYQDENILSKLILKWKLQIFQFFPNRFKFHILMLY